jgi:hypothetical protein
MARPSLVDVSAWPVKASYVPDEILNPLVYQIFIAHTNVSRALANALFPTLSPEIRLR